MPLPARLQGLNVGQLRQLAREDAREFIEGFGSVDYPLDVTALAREVGAEVFVAELGENVYGMIEGSASGATIYVDRESPLNRRRFTIAHELGHMVSYKDEAGLDTFVDVRDEDGRGNAAEIYANEFAGELLMPATSMREYIDQGFDNFDIARELAVSAAAVSYRRQILGI